MLQRAAREHDCVVGGGFIAIRGNDTRGTYAVVEPDGTARFHDKDQPSFWENNYYSAGEDDGVIDTSLGTIGVANGFEWGRTRTARRMLGRVQLLAGGMHFPSFPTWKATKPWFWDRDHFALVQYARETPPRMARLLGVPAVHPSHVGDFVMETMLVPGPRLAVAVRRRDRDLRRRRRRPASASPTRTAKAGSAPTSTSTPSPGRAIRCRPGSGTRCCRSRCTRSGTSATCTAA